MKAAVLTEIGKPFELLDLEQEGPKAAEVRVRVDATGICMSDLHIQMGDWPTRPPIVLGHEAAGTIEEVGPGVTSVKPGDRVIFSFLPQCGHCPSCSKGRPVLCTGHADVPGFVQYDGTMRLKLNGEDVAQMGHIGTFAEYVVCPAEQVIRMPDGMPAAPAALIGCSVATGVGAVTRHAKVEPGSDVVIIGCGGVGLNMVQGARLAGARRIIGVDLLDNKLEMARSFGATHTINASKDNPVEAVQEICLGPGADYAFDAIGGAVTAAQTLQMVKPGGHGVLVGMPAVDVTAQISPFMMVFGEKKLTGSFYGSVRANLDFPVLCELYMDGKLDLDRLISQTISLDQINQGFEDLKAGSVARTVIRMH